MSCDVGKPTEGFENQLWRRWSDWKVLRMSWAHSPTFPSLYLRHNSFSNPFVALPTTQLILQPFRWFTYVTVHSPTHLSLLLRLKLFTEFTWLATHASLGSRVCISVTPCWYSGGQNGIWVGFSRGFSRFPLPNISFHHFSTLLFYFISPCDGATDVVGRHFLLFTYLQDTVRTSSHPSTRSCRIRVEEEEYIMCYVSSQNI